MKRWPSNNCITYYRRDGSPYSEGAKGLMEWGGDLEKSGLRRVAETILPDGTRISTIWLGMDHSRGNGPPLIFETIVYNRKEGGQLEIERYSTEMQAVAGHHAMVNKWIWRLDKK